MCPEEMTDHILSLCSDLTGDEWNNGIDSLFYAIAEVEAISHGYSEEQINKLAKSLVREIKYARQAQRARSN